MRAARSRPANPILEAGRLVARELWDSRRARLLEGETVSVLLTSRRDSPASSDVSVTVIAKAGTLTEGGPVNVTLTGDSTHAGRLDGHGCCTIRGVPDGRYRVDLCRAPVPYASVLLLPGVD